MASTSGRRSDSSGTSGSRKKVHVGTGAPSRRLTAEPQAKVKVKPVRKTAGEGRSPESRSGTATRQRANSRVGDAAARAKRDERARRLAERSKARRKRTLLIGIVMVVVIAGSLALYNSSLFAIKVVDVQGTGHLSASAVATLAAVPEDATLLRYPGSEIIDRVQADPWVESVTVTRDFPDTLRIRVIERTPAALIDMGDRFWIVDSSGVVLGEQSFDESATLVVIRDVQGLDPKAGRRSSSDTLDNALAVLGGVSDELRAKVRAISAPAVDETTLLTTDAIEVMVGEATDLEEKSFLVLRIMQEQAGKVVFIDVRSVDNPISRGL